MQVAKTVRKNLISLTFLNVTEKFAGFVLVVLIARFLGKDVYGLYAFAVAYSTFFMIIADLGINTYLTRDIAQKIDEGPKYLSNSLSSRFLFSFISIILLYIIIQFFDYNTTQKNIILVVGAGILIRGTSQLIIAFLRAHQQMQYEAMSGFIERMIAVIGGALILFSGRGIVELVLLLLFAALIQLFYLLRVVNSKFTKIRFEFDIPFIGKIVREALPFLLANFMMGLNYRIDTVLISVFRTDGEVGLYNVAYNLVLSFMIIQNIFVRTMFPVLSKYSFTNEKKFEQAYHLLIKVMIVLVIPISTMITVNARFIIETIYGKEYEGSIVCLQILIWSLIFMFSSNTMGSVLLALKGEKYSFLGWAICAGFNLISNILIIPMYGIIGASFTTLLSEMVAFTSFYIFLVSRYNVFIIEKSVVLKFFVMVIMVMGLTELLTFLHIFLLIPVILISYAMAVFFIQIFKKEEIQIFTNIFSLKTL